MSLSNSTPGTSNTPNNNSDNDKTVLMIKPGVRKLSVPDQIKNQKQVYVILDAAQNEKVYKLLMASTEEYTCLFNGPIPSVLARAAPYLIKLPVDSDIFEEIYQKGFFNNWGVFLTSYASSKILKQHFQHFLKVKTEDGQRLYFRYYDPRVLRVYLKSCTKNELKSFFGPVNTVWAASETEQQIMEYRRDEDRFFINSINLFQSN